MSVVDLSTMPPVTLRADVLTRPARHVAASGLAGSALADRFCFWRGRSGRRYVFSIYRTAASHDLAGWPRYTDAVVIAAERRPDGTRRMLRVLQTGSLPGLMLGECTSPNAKGPANELHFHLLAGTAAERRLVVCDLDDPA